MKTVWPVVGLGFGSAMKDANHDASRTPPVCGMCVCGVVVVVVVDGWMRGGVCGWCEGGCGGVRVCVCVCVCVWGSSVALTCYVSVARSLN